MCLVDHALAQSEVGVWQVGQRLQQNLGRHRHLEVGGVKLVPAQEETRVSLSSITDTRITDMFVSLQDVE